MSSIYAKIFWLDDYEKPWLGFGKETSPFSLHVLFDKLGTEGSIQYVLFETSCKISCNFVIKLNI